MNKVSDSKVYIKLILAIITWAGVYHAANFLVRQLDMFSTAFIRYLIASIILLATLKIKNGYIFNKKQFQQHWLLLVATGVIEVVVSLNAIPFVTLIMGVILFNEKVSLPVVYCGIIIIIGVIMTNLSINQAKSNGYK